MLGEPFSFPADFLLERMNEDRPNVPVIGGMASGGTQPGDNRLLLGADVFDEGAVAVHVSGAVRLKTVVSQGCRPIGRPFVVTKAERNIIYELGGKPALVQLREIFDTLPTSEQRLVQRALHVGRVVSEYKERFEQGDFLIRNVIGIDANSGAIAIGDYLRPGQTVQFHVRDEEAADAELKQLLADARGKSDSRAGRRCSSPAMAAERGCFRSRTTTPTPSPGLWAHSARRLLRPRRTRPHRPAELHSRLHRQHRAVFRRSGAAVIERQTLFAACHRAATIYARPLNLLSAAVSRP